MKKIIFCTFLFSLILSGLYAQQTRSFKFPPAITKDNYKEGILIVKLRSSSDQSSNNGTANRLSAKPSISSIEKEMKALEVSGVSNPFAKTRQDGLRKKPPIIDLSNIYFLEIPKEKNLEESINLLLQNKQVEYAEPYYNRQLFVTPNDPHASPNSTYQYHLKLIKAYGAWDIQRGDSNMVIGILDTGVLPTHPDLKDNLKYNFADPINGVDDDNDGYIDNNLGWDFGDMDNNVLADVKGHGTEVAGCSNGFANNALGIAGTSYNCKFLPIKIFNGADLFSGGYEAILYAAEHGAKVINLSWGGGGESSYERDIVDHVVLDKDVVIIAAAGNSGIEEDFYPASYENILSVGATNSLDLKAGFSSYSIQVDISAPGETIGTTNNTGTYGKFSGTSYSSPIVAGAAALVRSKFPEYTARQVVEQLRVTADDIYAASGETAYYEKLGKGRLNMYNALTNTQTPSVRISSYSITNGLGNQVFYDDSIKISCELKNYLSPVSDLKVTLTSESPYVTILKNQFTISSLATLESVNNENPFEIYLAPNTPDSQRVVLRVGFEAHGYQDFQYIDFYTAPDFLSTKYNGITLTTTSAGRLGYRDADQLYGMGLKYDGKQFLGGGGIILATSPTKVSNNVVSNYSTSAIDENLQTTRDIRVIKGSYADVETKGTLVDTLSNPDKIGLVVSQKQYGFQTGEDSSYVILEYYITNFSGAQIPALFSGLYTDLDVGVFNENKANWDPENRLGYVYSSSSGAGMAGVALLTSGDSSFFAIDNGLDNGSGVNTSDGFSREEKYNTLANGVAKIEAGVSGIGGNVSQVLGVKIENLGDRKSTKVAFALVVGSSLEDLQTKAQRAKIKYNEYQLNPPISSISYFCSNNPATIGRDNNLTFNLYDQLPLTTPFYSGDNYQTIPLTSDTSFYITYLDEGFETEPTKIDVLNDDAAADFIMDKEIVDLLYDNKVTFTDNTPNSISREWDFNNGYKSTNSTTTRTYHKQGTYKINFTVKNRSGCTASLEKELVVVSTSPKPIVPEAYVCKNGNITITPINGSNFRFFDSFPLTIPVFTGNSYSLTNLTESKTVWITNVDSTYESEPLEFTINVWKDFVQFDLSSDTIDLDKTSILKVKDATVSALNWKWTMGDETVEGVYETSFNFNKVGTYTITLEVMNITGCTDTSSKQVIVLRKSPTPEIDDFSICANSSANINFESGTKYRFYEDLSSSPIFEGNGFETETLMADKRYFITNADSILESEPIELNIKVVNNVSDFSMSSDTLNLNENNTLSFNGTGVEIIDWEWNFGNGKSDSIQSPDVIFDSAGIYTIELITKNSTGCKDTIYRELMVVKSEYELDKVISIYPNPSENDIYIHAAFPEKEEVTITIYNYRGEVIREMANQQIGREVVKIDGSGFPSGFYFIKLTSSRDGLVKKVILYR